MVHYNMESIAL